MKRGDFIRSVRAQAALTAYSTALDWFQRLPAAEVHRRLTEKIAEKESEYLEAQPAVQKTE